MWLSIRSGGASGKVVQVTGERFVVGRDDNCDLSLADEKVSRQHAFFKVLADGRAILHDLETTNGTYVDGRRIKVPYLLQGSEKLRFGDTVATASLTDPRAQAFPLPTPQQGSVGQSTVQRLVGGFQRDVVNLRRSTRRATIVAVAAVAGAAALAALFLTGVLPPGEDEPPSISEIVDEARPSTALVLVLSRDGERLGNGSGWVLDAEEGLVVTNAHVVNGGSAYSVRVGDSERDATVVGVAPCEDLAVLRVEDTSDLRTLPLGSQQDLREGDSIVVLGYPGNLQERDDLTATQGVVSVAQTEFESRPLDVPQYSNVIQTDAAINPGNSGGPMVNLEGDLMGVNSAGNTLTPGGDIIQNQGYAIGVDRVTEIVPTLREGNSIGWTGLGLEYPTEESDLTALGLPAAVGLVVTGALPGTNADEALEQAGLDGIPLLLVAIDGEEVDNGLPSYCDVVGESESGDTATFTVIPPGASTTQDIEIAFE